MDIEATEAMKVLARVIDNRNSTRSISGLCSQIASSLAARPATKVSS
jgi:hypothetical protein